MIRTGAGTTFGADEVKLLGELMRRLRRGSLTRDEVRVLQRHPGMQRLSSKVQKMEARIAKLEREAELAVDP